MNFIPYDFAVAITVLCVVAYYFGTLARRYIPETAVGQQAIDAVRFVSLPLILVTAVVLSMMLFTARSRFNAKQDLVNDIAGASQQLDRALTYYGAPAAKAQTEFREYLGYLLKTPDAIWALKDRTDAEPFARDIQSLPVPAKDPGVAATTKKFMGDLMSKISLDRFMLGTMTSQTAFPATYSLLALWLVVTFACMGATAPVLNAWVFWFSCVAAACTGSITFIIAEYQIPTSGLIRLSTAPFELVLRNISP